MKKILLFLSALIVFNNSFAKIWRVNNNTGITADFTTAQAANDAVSVVAGDTIHLEPSSASYGAVTTSKRLIWLSIGALLGAHPGEQYSSIPGRLDGVNVYAGSANSVFSVYMNDCNLSAPNVGLIRCYINGTLTLNTYSAPGPDNDIILNCYILGAINIYQGGSHNISNNIIGDNIYCGSGAAFFVNNVINTLNSTSVNVSNCTLQNNIFNKAINIATFTNCVVEYNMSDAANILPTGNNNQNNIAMNTVFVNNNGSTDADFVLKVGSPAITAGLGGIDMGVFGGSTPFKFALQPAIPSINKIIAPATPSGSTMNVTFSTKSNN